MKDLFHKSSLSKSVQRDQLWNTLLTLKLGHVIILIRRLFPAEHQNASLTVETIFRVVYPLLRVNVTLNS